MRVARHLQEDEHDNDDQHQREQRLDDFVHAFSHRARLVERDCVIMSGGNAALRLPSISSLLRRPDALCPEDERENAELFC
jgi:hypothetical protein